MTTQRTVTVFELRTDSEQYKRGVEEANQLRARLADGFKLLGQEISSVNKITDSFIGTATIQRAEDYAAAVQKIGGVAKLTKEDQQRVNDAVAAALPYYARLGQEAPAHLQALEQATRKVEVNTKSLGDHLKDLGSKGMAAGTALTAGITAPLAGVAVASVKAATDFESAFAGVRKTVPGTTAELDAINVQFREMAKVTPVSAVGLAKIGEMAGQLGVQKAHITDFTKTIVDISVATNLTAEEAGSSFARLANVMKLPQEQFSNLGSAVVALGNFGASTEQEMLDMAQRIAAAGSTAGMTAPQVLGIANAMSSVGIEAEAGGTAISRVINKISMDVASGEGHLQTFAKVAGMSAAEFSAAWRENAGLAFSKFMQGLADARTRGGDELLGLIHELGFDVNVRLTNAFMSAANAGNLLSESMNVGSQSFTQNSELSRAAGERYKTTANQLLILKNNITDVAIELGNALTPMIQDAAKAAIPLIQTLDDAVKWFKALPTPVQETVFALAGIAAAVGPLILAFGGLARGINSLIELYAAIVPAAAAASTAIGETEVAVGALEAEMTVLGLNPIVLVLAAITTAVVAMRVEYVKGTQALRDHIQAADDAKTIQDAFEKKTALSTAEQKNLKDAIERTTKAVKVNAAAALDASQVHTPIHLSLDQAQTGFANAGAAPASAAGTAAAAAATQTYSEKLVAAREHLAQLSAEQRANLTALVKLHGEYKDLPSDIHLTQGEFDLFKEGLNQTAAALKKAGSEAKQHQQHLASVAAATENMTQATYDAIKAELEAATVGGQRVVTEKDIADKLGVSEVLVKRVADAEKERATASDKHAKAIEKNEDEISKLLDDATARDLAASGETTAAKIANVTKWANAQIDGLDRAELGEEAYWKRVIAIAIDADAKVGEIQQAADDKHATALDKIALEEEKSADRTASLWEKYNGLISKSTGDRLASQLAGVKASTTKEVAAVTEGLNKQLAEIRANNLLTAAEKEAASNRAIADAKKESDAIIAIGDATAKALKEAFVADWIRVGAQAISDIGEGLQSGNLGSGIGQAGQALAGQMIAGMKLTLKERAGIEIGQAIGQAVGGNNLGEQLGSSIGTAAGYAIGAAFGGPAGGALGAALGSAAGGAIGGFIDKIHQGHQISNAVLDVAKEMGNSLSQGLATGIATTAANIQEMDKSLSAATARHYAELLNLDKIIAEQGGLNAGNLTKWATQAERLFEVIAKGGQVGAAATQELSAILGMFASQAEDAGGLWDDAFKKLIADSKAAGVGIDEINKLVKGQQNQLASSLGKVTGDIAKQAQSYKDLKKAVEEAAKARQDALDNGTADDTDRGSDAQRARFKELDQALTDAKKKLAGVTVTSQEEFDRLSRIALASFNTIVASGADAVTAMQQVGGSVDALIANADAFGLSGNAAFDELKRWRQLTTDNAALIDSISGLNTLMTATANLGGLTADGFADLQAQGVSAYDKLIAAGLSQQEAETIEKGFLENIIKLHKDKGLAIDEATQKLIDQATADGVLGAQEESTQQTLREGLGALIETLGGTLPEAWKKFSDAGKDATDKVTGPDGLGKVGDALEGPGGLGDKIDDGSVEWKIWKKNSLDAMDAAAKKADDTAGKIGTAFDDLDITIPINFDVNNPDWTGYPHGDSGGPSDPSASARTFSSFRSFDLGPAARALSGASRADVVSLAGALSQVQPPAHGTSTIVLERDGRAEARWVVPHIIGDLRRLQLTR